MMRMTMMEGVHQAQGGHHRPQDGAGDAPEVLSRHVAHIGGHIDPDGAGGGLPHGDHVGQVVVGDQPVASDMS